MKKLLCIMFVIACVYAMPAYARDYLTVTTEADCEGLTISGTVCGYYQHHPGNLLVYTINVNGEIITGEMWEEVDLDEWACLPVEMYIPLTVEMCGDVEISGIIDYYGSYEEFDNNNICSIYEIEEFVSDCRQCDPVEECSECDGKVTELTLQYIGDLLNPNITVLQKDGAIVYDEMVVPGVDFTIIGTEIKARKNDAKLPTLGTEITIDVNDDFNTKIHTSCSKYIGPGMVTENGDFTVIEAYSLNGGLICEGSPDDDIDSDSDSDSDSDKDCDKKKKGKKNCKKKGKKNCKKNSKKK